MTEAPVLPVSPPPPAPAIVTAAEQALVLCRTCHQLSALASATHCRRCHAPLHARKPNSLMRTWALVITSLILLIPANFIPIMTVVSFGKHDPSTILSGIIKLWQHQQFAIAIIVFVASFVVPLFKLGALLWLLAATEGWLAYEPLKLTRLYRFLEFIGRWSMLDIFVVALMVAVVQLGNVSRVIAGNGSLAFCAVVVLTMLASHSFDPRLLWDRVAKNNAALRTLATPAVKPEEV